VRVLVLLILSGDAALLPGAASDLPTGVELGGYYSGATGYSGYYGPDGPGAATAGGPAAVPVLGGLGGPSAALAAAAEAQLARERDDAVAACAKIQVRRTTQYIFI